MGQALGSLVIGFTVAWLGLFALFVAGGVLVLMGAGLVWRKKPGEMGSVWYRKMFYRYAKTGITVKHYWMAPRNSLFGRFIHLYTVVLSRLALQSS